MAVLDTVVPDILKKGKEGDQLAELDAMFEKARKARIPFERQWYMNLAFYFGKQNLQWTPGVAGDFTRLYEPPAPPWRVRLISNKVRPIVRAELAKVTKEKPQAFVIPASSDDDDIAAAMAGDSIYEYVWRVLNMNREIRRAEFWAILVGNGFVKDWYDVSAKDFSGQQGSIGAEAITPFHLFVPNVQEEELEKQPWVIHLAAKDPDWVKERYDKKIEPDSNSSAGVLEQRFLSAMGASGSQSKNEYVSVKEIWIKPCSKFKDGAVFLWAGNEMLWSSEEDGGQRWPFDHGEYPFTKFDHIPTGRFYSESTVTDLIPLQKEYNRTRSQIIEAKNRMSKPQLVAARGSVDASKMTSEPGLIIFYTPGYQPPTPLPLQNLPSYVIEELDRCQRDMDDISSQHEITKGRTPPGVTAATAISYLQEEDDSKLAHTVASLEEGVERIGGHFLSYVNQFWDAPRKIKVVGENRITEAFEFTKADLRGNTDLKVETGSATPRSRAAKQAFITDLMEKGIIPPERGLRYLEMAETSRLYEELQIDSRHAQQENLRMKGGDTSVTVNSWDNNAVHIDEHNNERKKQWFINAPEELKMFWEQHVQTHQMMLAQQQGTPILPGQDPTAAAAQAGMQQGDPSQQQPDPSQQQGQ